MPASQRRWTAIEVRALMDESRPAPRYELMDGELLVTPAPGPKHQMAAVLLWQKLQAYLQPRALGTAYVSPADIELVPGTILQPDVFVVPPSRTPLQRWSEVRRLLLAAEILSPGSALYDRVRKSRFFRAQRVPEYWIVDLDARIIERADPERDAMVFVDDQLEWLPSGAREPFVMGVGEYFASVHGDAAG